MEYILIGSLVRPATKKEQLIRFKHGDKITPTERELKQFPEKFIAVAKKSNEANTNQEVLNNDKVTEIINNTETPTKENTVENQNTVSKRNRRNKETVQAD